MASSLLIPIIIIVAWRAAPRIMAFLLGVTMSLVGCAVAIFSIIVAIQDCHIPSAGWGWLCFDLHRMGFFAWSVIVGCLVAGMIQACLGVVLVRWRKRPLSGAV